MSCRLVYSIEGNQFTYSLEGDEITIGRSLENDLSINAQSVSRRHARLYRDDDRWHVEDLGSRNGTTLNEQEEPDRPLRHGDVICLGYAALTFHDDSAKEEFLDEGLFSDTVFRSTVEYSELIASSSRGGPSAHIERMLAIVSEASRAILESRSLDETFQRVLDVVFAQLPVDRGLVLLWDDEREELTPRCWKSRLETESGDRMRFSRTIAERVFREKVSVMARDAQVDGRFEGGESVGLLGIRSVMAAPIWNGDAVEGLICLDTAQAVGAFKEFDVDLLSALGNHLAVAIEQARLQRVALEKERMTRDLAVAREIQIGTLPARVPELPGYDLAGLSLPAEETGGDTYDLIPIDDERLILLLGDATGHGIGPALSVTQVRSMLRVAVRLGAELDETFRHINDQLSEDLDDRRYVTAFLGLLDAERHRIRFHSGGQGPILHYHAADDRFDWHPATTVPMGFLPIESPKKPRTLDLAPGDILGLMTDGVFEAEDPSGQMLGRSPVERLVRTHRDASMRDLAGAIVQGIDEHTDSADQADDITIVLVRRLPADGTARPRGGDSDATATRP